MLYREIIAVCSEIHTKNTNTVCGQNVEFFKILNLMLRGFKRWRVQLHGKVTKGQEVSEQQYMILKARDVFCGRNPSKISLTTFRNPWLTKMCCINELDRIGKQRWAGMWTHWHWSSECIAHIKGNSEIWESNRFVNEESCVLGFFWHDVWTDRHWRWRQ